MEDHELELALSISSSSSTQINEDFSTKRKRNFHESFSDDCCSKRTLPLLTLITDREKEEEDGLMVVGWPPVKFSAKKHRGGGGGGSQYVKVEMEGVGIARKIELSAHNSYQTLAPTVMAMFGIGKRGEIEIQNLKLTYQDEDGDWLLAGDIPWGRFVGSVRRLKLVRN